MIFHRSTPERVYKDYSRYQNQLRDDFLNRCAYCIRHEKHFGGAANGQIDHLFPEVQCRATGQLKLVYDYENLFWSCGECNNTKKDSWPSPEERQIGYRFVDSTKEDTREHWDVLPSGEIIPISFPGQYTIDEIVLWRDDLVRWRRETYEALQRVERIKRKLRASDLSAQAKEDFHLELRDKMLFLLPYPINRTKKGSGIRKSGRMPDR